jgi:hypothetical protein
MIPTTANLLAEAKGRKCYVVTVEDTVTYRRRVEVTVWAHDRDEAQGMAIDGADMAMSTSDNVEEDQIDNTPYQVIAVHT